MSVTIIPNRTESTLFAVFGAGLIGGEVIKLACVLCENNRVIKTDFDWSNPDSVRTGVVSVLEFARTNSIKALEVFWCAGRAGFSATKKVMQKEQSSYQAAILQFGKEQEVSICVNFLSSAGGLYEGVPGYVSGDSPMPVRPYGKYKLLQEQYLKASGISYRIYRPTTVYGRAREGARSGLIATLVDNTFKQIPTTIHASPNTLRDYIYVRDVARLMVLNVSSKSIPGEEYIVASGRPVSIYYLLEKVRLAVGKRPRVNYVPSLGNDQNMHFSGISIPNFSALTSLEEGIRLLARQQWIAQA